ncbi:MULTISPECIES: iron-containing alcohol dehydrogenase [unclassified Campylobacter]|uniref:iron-containing alcohol dehydrogenase n=1 Tax=unclassified Campylobacter TaxID=2593542 RepID=UPI0022E9DB54|nr:MULTISPECIES: iron-containing alcohol dehydrogenase [unclassified Campylobacter]MDA3065772.1 iron-containing alcohol dehydrogenase [Campylobacter sp. CN_NE4]MDA3068961.1 iron-containing alcohol dehydrogenase [Campylobacter sp. CN_NE3]MDA3083225.1 iron-containing alcohol dehydrogenase [Campylobacter sp. CN_EL2]MDA3084601.1 iron-containing alcohol dehydrogenase [Campylobacter sp. CN_NE1]MDA3087722.1 iron-containing alcohol dehydrogenase [Campylobacter sp. CN_NA2]
MQDFKFYNPTRIEFGKGKEKNIGSYMSEFGAKRVLVVYGSDRVKKSGLFEVAINSLKANGIEFTELGGVKSNPVLTKVREGVKIAKEFKADSVLAIGGGSVLDSCKAIAAGAVYDGDVWDFFVNKSADKALMIFDIITLAATGSEMNRGGVVTNEETKEKFGCDGVALYPKVSVINPELQKTVSKEYLVYSASDIIAHSIEGYFTATAHPEIIRAYIEANIKTVMKTTEILLKEPENYEARGDFAWAATMALNGLTYVGISVYSYPNHMIEHAMSAVTDCPHGAGLSVVMPAWMKFYKERNLEAFERFAKEIFGLNSADDGINALKAWFEKIGTPTKLSQVGIDNSNLDEIINLANSYTNSWGGSEIYTKENLAKIFEMAK